MNPQIYNLLVKVHFIEQAQLRDADWWSLIWCPPTALDITRQLHHLLAAFFTFFFLDANQSCTVIKIRFCASSLGKQVWFQEDRKQPHSIWHTRVITGGRVLGHLYSVWRGRGWGWRGAVGPSGLNPVPLESEVTGLHESCPHHYRQNGNLHPYRPKINFAVCCKMKVC